MRIVRLSIERFRAIRSATLFPTKHNVYLGPNNVGKTAILEALNLLLNPELGYRGRVVDENDFYRRQYRLSAPDVVDSVDAADEAGDLDPPESDGSAEGGSDGTEAEDKTVSADASPSATVPPSLEEENHEPDAAGQEELTEEEQQRPPIIRFEAVITDLADEDLVEFSSVLVPWNPVEKAVIEMAEEGDDPFANNETAIRPCFEAWYDEDEDDFVWKSFFRTDPHLSPEESPSFTKRHKRRIGFLIYRDFRALQRPITLEPFTLFGRLLQSQEATPKHFENVLAEVKGVVTPLFKEQNFARAVNEYRQELLRYLPLANIGEGHLSFEATDRTREQMKAVAQIYVKDEIALPLQKMGAGTRSLAILAILLLIARKRGRGIIALEEPETFLFPHAQRRVIDEVLALASQTFVTTHSPYVLERMPVESYQRLLRDQAAKVSTSPLVTDTGTARQIRDRFRKQLSEALLGRGAIVVEEESTRLWILRASALLHGSSFEGNRVEALELQGVSVVAAAGNGDVPSVGTLLLRAGLQVIGFLDQVTEEENKQYVSRAPDLPFVYHAFRGLEDLLLQELPRDLVVKVLTEAPHTRHSYTQEAVANWTDDEFEDKARKYLKRYKGYQPLHEWVLDQVDAQTMPLTFRRLVALESAASSGQHTWKSCSLLWH